MLPTTYVPSRSEKSIRGEYGYPYDMATFYRPVGFLRHEIKHRDDLIFTCAEDFPFDSILVDRKKKVDGSEGEVDFYVSINKGLTHFAIIYYKCTRDKWYPRLQIDRKYDPPHEYLAYFCPIEFVQFGELEFGKPGELPWWVLRPKDIPGVATKPQ